MNFQRSAWALACALCIAWAPPARAVSLPAEPEGFTLEAALAKALALNPNVQAAKAKLEEAKIERAQQDTWWAKLFNAHANYIMAAQGTAYNAATAAGTAPYASFGFGFNVGDLLAGPKGVERAQEGVKIAEAELKKTRLEVAAQVTAAYQEYEAAKELAATSAEGIEAAETDMRVAERQFSLGTSAVNALLTARLAIRRAKQESLQSGGNVAKAWSQLLNVMGDASWLSSQQADKER